MTSSSLRLSTRHSVIDLTDSDDEDKNHDTRLYIARLEAQIIGLQTEVLDLKAELEHTQVDLKYSKEKLKKVVATSTSRTQTSTIHISTMLKRPRSPSIESVDPQASKKGKGKLKDEVIVKPSMSPVKPKLEAYVSVPTVKLMASQAKIEKVSPKKPTICFSDDSNSSSQPDNGHVAKRRRLDWVEQSDSELDLSLICGNTPSRTTTPDIQAGQHDQVVPHKPSARPTQSKRHVALTTTSKVDKADDNSNPVAIVNSHSTGLVLPNIAPVPRAVLHRRYGGQVRTLIQEIKEEHNPSSALGLAVRQLIFPDFEHNPDLPLKPGAPGLMYASREDVQGHSFSLFVRSTRFKHAVWEYFGEYKAEKCGTLSTKRFCSLSNKVQDAWAKSIHTAKSEAAKEYVAMRVRIEMRKNRVAPKAVIEQLDILKAMREGQEHIDVVVLTFTSYDRAFAEDIQRTFEAATKAEIIHRFIHPHAVLTTANTKSKKTKSRKGSSSQGTAVRRTKKKVNDFIEDDDDEASDPSDRLRAREKGGPVSDRQLRPQKSARPVLPSDSDYESEWSCD